MRTIRHLFFAFLAFSVTGCGSTLPHPGTTESIALHAATKAKRQKAMHADLRCLERNKRATMQLDIFMRDPFFPERDPHALAASPGSTAMGTGTGTVVNADGYVLTAAHLLDQDGEETVVRIVIHDRIKDEDIAYVGRPIEVNRHSDVALIKFETRFEDVVTIAPIGEITSGDDIYGVGFPFAVGKLIVRGTVMGTDILMSNNKSGRVILDLHSGPGASGGGLFSPRTGGQVVVYQGTHAYQLQAEARIYDFIRYGASTLEVRKLLDKARVPYTTSTSNDCL